MWGGQHPFTASHGVLHCDAEDGVGSRGVLVQRCGSHHPLLVAGLPTAHVTSPELQGELLQCVVVARPRACRYVRFTAPAFKGLGVLGFSCLAAVMLHVNCDVLAAATLLLAVLLGCGMVPEH